MKDNTPSGPPKKSDYNFGFGHNDAANYERDLKMYNDKMNQENKSVEEIAKEYADKEADPMFSHLSSENNSIKRHFKAGFLAAYSKGKEEEIEIIDGYTQLAIDRRSLPKDGQHVKFMTENEDWHEGYFVEGDDIFHVTDSKFYFKWHVQQWKEI